MHAPADSTGQDAPLQYGRPAIDPVRGTGRLTTGSGATRRRRTPRPWLPRLMPLPALIAVFLLRALSACSDAGRQPPDADRAMAATSQAGSGAPAQLGLCASCHGRDGIAVAADAPDLAGRNRTELLAAMQAYLDGRREHGPMRAMLGPIRPDEREQLADWFAAQVPRPGDGSDAGGPATGAAAPAAVP